MDNSNTIDEDESWIDEFGSLFPYDPNEEDAKEVKRFKSEPPPTEEYFPQILDHYMYLCTWIWLFSLNIRYPTNRDRKLAFLMASHSRLGVDSPARVLSKDLFQYICSCICYTELLTGNGYIRSLSCFALCWWQWNTRWKVVLHWYDSFWKFGYMHRIRFPIQVMVFTCTSSHHKQW